MHAVADNKFASCPTLALGTGKTFIAFAWKLFTPVESNLEPRRRPCILFLADRNILANQTYKEFSGFRKMSCRSINPDGIRKQGRVPADGSLFLTIFQIFTSGPPKDGKTTPYFGDYPPDFFDFIIIGVCPSGLSSHLLLSILSEAL
ncbi:MAG TPA: DEAD/DEAH box helicase family protein [Candidatus Binataceae bacterium]|nr:DEAD/DEAH box helicase family protein [Candidatus Binataceae bacterium]